DDVIDAGEGRLLAGHGAIHRSPVGVSGLWVVGPRGASGVVGGCRCRADGARLTLPGYGRAWPLPVAIHLVLVSSGRPMGPRAWAVAGGALLARLRLRAAAVTGAGCLGRGVVPPGVQAPLLAAPRPAPAFPPPGVAAAGADRPVGSVGLLATLSVPVALPAL